MLQRNWQSASLRLFEQQQASFLKQNLKDKKFCDKRLI